MSLHAKIVANKAAITGLFNKASKILKGKRQSAKKADVTLKVGGYTLSALTTYIREMLKTHLDKTGAAHGETAASIGLLTTAQLNTGIAGIVPQDIVPIARYGSLNYLPPGLSGNFDSGTTPVSIRSMAGVIEDDGTFVYLRNGTNGSTRGVYYAYCRGIMTNPSVQPTRTGKRYAPSWFPAGMSAQYILMSSDTVILGRLQDSAGIAGDYFVSITNGTMDDTKHIGGIITQAEFATYDGTYGDIAIHGDTVYLFTTAYGGSRSTTPLQVTVLTLPLATLRAANGGAVAFTKTTGWTTTGFGGAVYTKDMLYFTDKLVSAVASEKPMILATGTYTSTFGVYFDAPFISSALSPDGSTIRMKAWASSRFTWAGGDFFAVWTCSWTFNPATKVCKLDDGYEQPNTVVQGTNVATTYSGPIYQAITNDQTLVTGQTRPWLYNDNSGNVVKFAINNVTDAVTFMAAKVQSFTDKYSAYNGFTKVNRIAAALTITPQFGSAIGSNLMAPVLLDSDTLLLLADGAKANGSYFRAGAYTKLEGTPTYEYASATQTAFKGWGPSKNRKALSDMGFDENHLRGTVNEVTGNEVTLSGKRFVRGIKTSGTAQIKPDLTTSPLVTVSDSALASLDTALRAIVEANQSVTTQTTVVDLIVPDKGCPPFVLFGMLTTSGAIYYTVCKVNLTLDSNGNITAAALNGSQAQIFRSVGVNATAIPASLNNLRQGGNVAIYSGADSYLIGLCGSYNNVNVGANWLISIMFRINKTTGDIVVTNNYKGANFNYYGSTRGFVALPGRGLGAIFQSAADTDDTTKLVWHPMPTTSAEFDLIPAGYQAPLADRIVLATQDVAEGFVVYFSEETPLVIGGRYFTLPVSNVDLTTIKTNPANTTFFVYAQVTDGTAEYAVSLNRLEDSNVSMFLGTVTTGAAKIATIAVDKVTRIGNFRLTPTAKGQAIPVSQGLPSKPSRLEWR